MNSFGLLVLWAICAIVVNRLYHKLFAVFYFSFGAVLRELIFTIGISGILTAAILTLIF
jgi:hypothetical protein